MFIGSIRKSIMNIWGGMGLRVRLEIFIVTAFLPLVGLVLSLYLHDGTPTSNMPVNAF